MRLLLGGLVLGALAAPGVWAQKSGQSGTTLAGYKTLDICEVNPQTWRYSGVISVWNSGAIDTVGLKIVDTIESKAASGPNWNLICSTATSPGVTISPAPTFIPAGTSKDTATLFQYVADCGPAPFDIRNTAKITITNHSGQLGKDFGPEPKYTYDGPQPPPLCDDQQGGCVYTQGYWGNKPGVIWPAPYDRNAMFFLSGKTWQEVLDTAPQGNAYYQLAHQYIAAVLNAAIGAPVPVGVQDTINLATAWLLANAPSACPQGNSCGTQKTWAGALDQYNNGIYPGGPPHCNE